MKPLALVTPWFGADLRGGAEQQARQIARRLSARGHAVEVLTTCARSFHHDWSANHHAPGAITEDGLTIRRFPCDPRDAAAFDRANARLLSLDARHLKLGVSPVADEDADAFVRHNINSAALVSHIRRARDGYRAFVFIPYLYGTTLAGLPAAAGRALLQPCLHDEPYARLPAVEEIFRLARRVLFNSEGERELALKLYGPGITNRSVVVGEGVETFTTGRYATAAAPPRDDSTRATSSRGDDETASTRAALLPAELREARFVLCLGRRGPEKNTPLLVGAYGRFRREHPDADLKLVLAGEGDAGAGGAGGVFDLGVVGEGEKAALLSSARALFQPSRNESFSRAMMEAWLAGRPVAAHAHCLATAEAVRSSRGGWLAATEEEWAELFARADAAADEELDALSALGRSYAARHADWDEVVTRYEAVLDALDEEDEETARSAAPRAAAASPRATVAPPTGASLRAVHQLLPDFVFGDAISNHAVAIRDALRGLGHESEIFARRREEGAAGGAWPFVEGAIEARAGILYHHSIGSEVTAAAIAHAGPKCLVYHNVTPHEFFAPYRPGFAWLLEAGRAQLPRLAPHFPVSAGVSPFNAAELSEHGFGGAGVLPIVVSPDKWDARADERLMERLQDGRTNLLFVGRVAPNKRQDELVRIFAEYAALDPESRLVIAGDGQEFDPYFRGVLGEIKRLGLTDSVLITGRVNNAGLLACYRTAHLYLSASEHEGFGVPLVEAMWFGVPVLARRTGAVPDTLDGAGVLFEPGTNAREVARLAKLLARDDQELRGRVVGAQRRRREAFTPRAVRPALEEIVRRMEAAAARGAAGGGAAGLRAEVA